MSKHTKYALGESLKKILQKKPLNKITVTEIVNDCGVNRMTFYYHFHDIYDLLEWVCVKDAEKALEGKSYHSNWQEGLANLLSKVQENKSFVMHIYQSMSRDYLERYLYRLTEALFIGVINAMDKDRTLKTEDKEFIASYYKYAFLGILINWIDGNMQEDPKDIIEKLSILVDGDLVSAISRFKTR